MFSSFQNRVISYNETQLDFQTEYFNVDPYMGVFFRYKIVYILNQKHALNIKKLNNSSNEKKTQFIQGTMYSKSFALKKKSLSY